MIQHEKTLVFTIGEENSPVILDNKIYKDSLFENQITRALNFVGNYVSAVEKAGNEQNNEKLFPDAFDNHTISFIGDRGTGKSSCMFSVMNVIKRNDKDGVYKGIYILKSIDPSFFDEKHNILEIFIGRLYEMFELESDNETTAEKYDTIRKLRIAFQEVKSDLKFLEKERYLDDSELEELAGLASGINLRESVQNLIRCFLRLFDKHFIILPIDDIDLNTRQAYVMAEQVRKYLIMPELIIFIACKIDQLFDAISLVNTKEYTPLLNTEQIAVDDITAMTETYINKFLPINYRIFMPTFDNYENRRLTIKNGENEESYPSVKQAILNLIYKKTKILFYNSKGQTNLIVPTRLRDIRGLIRLLVNMTASEKNDQIWKNDFLDYFFNEWTKSLSTDRRKFIQELKDEKDASVINHIVISRLKALYNLNKESNISVPDWGIIIGNTCRNYNLSLGDVFTVMNYITETYTDTETRRLVFFVKSLYSIRLQQYCDRAYNQQSPSADNEEEPELKHNVLDNVTDLRKLIGGRFFNLTGGLLIPPDRNGKIREFGILNGTAIKTLIENVIKQAKGDEHWKENQKIVKEIQTAEFLMLISSHYFYTKTAIENMSSVREERNGSFRERQEVYYERSLKDVKNIYYEVTSPFFNLLDVEHTYRRFDDLFVSVVEACKDSLIRQMADFYNIENEEKRAEKNGNETNCFLTNFYKSASIYNIDIYEDLFQDMLNNRNNTDGTSLSEFFRMFYQRVSEYSIRTYEKNREGKYKEINFKHFKVLADFLKDNHDWERYLLSIEEYDVNFPYIKKKVRTKVREVKNDIPDDLKENDFEQAFNAKFGTNENKTFAFSTIIKRLNEMVIAGALKK